MLKGITVGGGHLEGINRRGSMLFMLKIIFGRLATGNRIFTIETEQIIDLAETIGYDDDSVRNKMAASSGQHSIHNVRSV